MRGRRWLFLAALSISASACDTCESCRSIGARVKGELANPEPQEAEKLVREELAKNRKAATKLCGAPSGPLGDVELVVEKGVLTSYDVKVKGKPTPAPTASAAAAPASSADAAKAAAAAALCTGVLYVMFDADVAENGTPGPFRIWKLEVTEVTTPGHEWKKPSESSDWD